MEDVRAEDMDWAIKSLYRNEVKTRLKLQRRWQSVT